MSSFLNVFKRALGLAPPVSRQVAKERLSIMLVHQRSTNILSDIDMKAFQTEIQGVVSKYLKISVHRTPQITG
jgi:septum formation topological specificity factor MinE